eukprot:gene6301-1123_t
MSNVMIKWQEMFAFPHHDKLLALFCDQGWCEEVIKFPVQKDSRSKDFFMLMRDDNPPIFENLGEGGTLETGKDYVHSIQASWHIAGEDSAATSCKAWIFGTQELVVKIEVGGKLPKPTSKLARTIVFTVFILTSTQRLHYMDPSKVLKTRQGNLVCVLMSNKSSLSRNPYMLCDSTFSGLVPLGIIHGLPYDDPTMKVPRPSLFCRPFRLLQKIRSAGQQITVFEENLNPEWETICDQIAKRFAVEFLQKDFDFLMAGIGQ